MECLGWVRMRVVVSSENKSIYSEEGVEKWEWEGGGVVWGPCCCLPWMSLEMEINVRWWLMEPWRGGLLHVMGPIGVGEFWSIHSLIWQLQKTLKDGGHGKQSKRNLEWKNGSENLIRFSHHQSIMPSTISG